MFSLIRELNLVFHTLHFHGFGTSILASFSFVVMFQHCPNSKKNTLRLIAHCSTRKNINNKSWESESGDFAFGFQQIGKDGFLLAIWFNKMPEKTVVWSANRDNLVQEGSKVELTVSGLFLIDQTGKQTWNTAKTPAPKVSYAALLDTGNLVLANQDSANLWESFDVPTDTLLPTQTLAVGMILLARYSELNYSRGRFHLNMSDQGPPVYKRAFPVTEVG